MLVLSRKKDESIVIDDDIVVTVIEIRPNSVRLGITAPKEIPILRGELARTTEADGTVIVDIDTSSETNDRREAS